MLILVKNTKDPNALVTDYVSESEDTKYRHQSIPGQYKNSMFKVCHNLVILRHDYTDRDMIIP